MKGHKSNHRLKCTMKLSWLKQFGTILHTGVNLWEITLRPLANVLEKRKKEKNLIAPNSLYQSINKPMQFWKKAHI